MTAPEIQRRLKFWLCAQSLEVEIVSPRELRATFGNHFLTWQCRMICEDAPLTVHYLARLPGRVAESNIPDLAVRLLDLNRGIRFGQFSLDSQKRTVTFRLTQKIETAFQLDKKFYEATRESHETIVMHGRSLMHFLNLTKAARPSIIIRL